MSEFYSILNKHWLWKEMRSKLNLSNPAYSYWKESHHIKLNRYVFIQKDTIPERFTHVQEDLTDLTGYLPIQYASSQLNVDAHVFNYKMMRLHNRFEYKFVENIKFVNIRRFFKEHAIEVNKNSTLQLGKLNELCILPNSKFYRIDDDYGVVVYD